MPSIFGIGLKACWLAFAIYFLWAYRRNKAPQQTEPLVKRLVAYWLPFGIALLLGPGDWLFGNLLWQPFVPHTTFADSKSDGSCSTLATSIPHINVAQRCYCRPCYSLLPNYSFQPTVIPLSRAAGGLIPALAGT